jgi:O-antigen/teichoic acid export membrane protein
LGNIESWLRGKNKGKRRTSALFEFSMADSTEVNISAAKLAAAELATADLDAAKIAAAADRRASVSRQNDRALEAISGIPAASEFKRKSVRGGAAAVFSQGTGMALQIVTTVVLARLLSPTDYGLQAMVVTLTGFFSLFKDAGLSVATVQRETLTHEQISTLFWINTALGALLMILVAAAGPFLVVFYKEPRLLWITAASATVFFVNSLAVQHRALLDRSMQFTIGAKIEILSAVVGTVVAITMAALGCGYWSLIVQTLSLYVVGTAGAWIAMPWIPGRPKWTPELRSMVRFGGTVTLNSFVVYIAYNTEKILLGRFWGPASLGLYGRAYQLSNLPVQQLTGSVGTVAFPMLSRMQSDAPRLRRSYLKAHSLVVSLTVPVVITCALFADEIVSTVLGPKWAGTAGILRLLSPTILIFALMNPLSWLLRSTGRVERSLKIALMIAPAVILGVVAGLRYGPTGVAAGYSAAMILLVVPTVAWAIRGTGVTAADYFDCIKRPLLAGVLGGAAGWLFKHACHGALTTWPLVLGEVSISFGVYAIILLFALGQKALYVDLLGQVLHRDR